MKAPLRRANIFGVSVDAVDLTSAVDRVYSALADPPAYVCLASAHGVVEARRSPELRLAYQDAALILPDGMPTVWIGRQQGFKNMDRVFGPDVMLQVFERSQHEAASHFLLGGMPGVAEELASRLAARFPTARIGGTYTPPFRDLTPAEEADLFDRLRRCQPDFLWVGLSTPKQEIFMRRYQGLLQTKVMIGVGAAFDFHTGRLRDSPAFIKRAGLQWLHRLVQEPRRLWRRYLRTNTIFVGLAMCSLLGLKDIEPVPLPSSFEVPVGDE